MTHARKRIKGDADGQTYQNESSAHANPVAHVSIMSRLLQPYIPILKKITRMREAKGRAYLKECDRNIIECFSECAKNLLNNNIVLKKGQFDRSKKKKADVRKLAHPRTTLKQKRRILRQKGSFVTLLLVPAITALGSVLVGQLFPQQQ